MTEPELERARGVRQVRVLRWLQERRAGFVQRVGAVVGPIEQIEHLDDAVHVALQAADAEEYRPTERWDAIVFNECVYYFEDPIGTVLGYREGLKEGGTLIVSTFRSRRADVIAKRLIEKLPLIEEVAVTNRKGTWVVRLFRP